MNEIIDVEYKEIRELTDRSTEELAAEANTLWSQMEAIGNLGMMMAGEAGKRLVIIKERLPHGQWEAWAKSNLDFSIRKANNMMKLAQKMDDENSLFSNPQTFADIGISKVWELLAAPEEVAEEIIKKPEAGEMSVREFQEEIRRLKEKNANLEESIEQVTAAGNETELALQKQIQEMEAEIKIYKEAPAPSPESEKEIDRLQAELEKTKESLTKEKERAKKIKANLEAEKRQAAAEAEAKAEAAAAEAAAKAEAAAREKFETENRLIRESNAEAAREIDRLQRLQENSQSVAEFKVHSDQLQQSFLKCLACAEENSDPDRASKMRNALRAVLEQLLGRIS